MKKICFKCGEEKPRNDFYKHAQMGDGLLGKCKECTKNDTNKNRLEKIEYYKEYDRQRGSLDHRAAARRKYVKTKNGMAALKKGRDNWYKKNKHKKEAQGLLARSIRRGEIVKDSCSVCGINKRVHGHHEDYSKPLEVIWLCPKHHGERHKEINAERRKLKQL